MRWGPAIVVAAAVAFGAAPLASAAPASFRWTGFYIGGNVGYGWDDASADVSSNTILLGALINVGTIPRSLTTNPNGWLGGVQLGYNYQIDKIVLGVEADFSLANIDGKASAANPGPILPFATYTTSAEQRLKWFGTLRGRLGFVPADMLLVYATGGLAFGETDYGANIRRTAILLNYNVPASADVTKVGWTLGGGAEYAVTKNWTLKAEYLYYDLGREALTGFLTIGPVVTATAAHYDFATRGSIARFGLNYKFD